MCVQWPVSLKIDLAGSPKGLEEFGLQFELFGVLVVEKYNYKVKN